MQKKSKINSNKIVKSGLYNSYEESPYFRRRIHYVQKDNYVYYISTTISDEVELIVYNLNSGSIVYSEILVDYLEVIQVELLLIDSTIHIVYHTYGKWGYENLYYQGYDIDEKTHTNLITIDEDINLYEYVMSNLVYQNGNLYLICLLYNGYLPSGYEVAYNGTLTIYKYDTSWTKYDKRDIYKSVHQDSIYSYLTAYYMMNPKFPHRDKVSPYFILQWENYGDYRFKLTYKTSPNYSYMPEKWKPNYSFKGSTSICPSWSPTINYGFGEFWYPDHNYGVGDIVLFTDGDISHIYNNMRNDIYWVCTKAGKSGLSFPTSNYRSWPNSTFYDGTVEWKVRCLRSYDVSTTKFDGYSGSTEPTQINQGLAIDLSIQDNECYFDGGQLHELPWLPNQVFYQGEYIREGNYVYYVRSVIGSSHLTGTSKPNFPTTHGQTVDDKDIRWVCFDPHYIFDNTMGTYSFDLFKYPEDFYVESPHYYVQMDRRYNNNEDVQLDFYDIDDNTHYVYQFVDDDIIESGTDPLGFDYWIYEKKIPCSDFNKNYQECSLNIKTDDMITHGQFNQYTILYFYYPIDKPYQQQRCRWLFADSDTNYLYLSIPNELNTLDTREGEIENKEIYKINLSNLTLANKKNIIPFDYEQDHFEKIEVLSDDDYLYLPYYNWDESHIKFYKIDKSNLTLTNSYDLTDTNEWISTLLFSKIKDDKIYILNQSDFNNDEKYIYAIIIFDATNNNFYTYRIPHLLKDIDYSYVEDYIAYNLEEINKNRLSIIRWNSDINKRTLEHLFVKSGGGFFFFYENG